MSDIADFGEWLAQQDLPPTPTCATWGEMLRDNALYLLDQGELHNLRAWLLTAIEEYGDVPLPKEVTK